MVQKAGSISGFPSNDADLYTALVQHRYRKHISPIKFSDHNPSSKCSNIVFTSCTVPRTYASLSELEVPAYPTCLARRYQPTCSPTFPTCLKCRRQPVETA